MKRPFLEVLREEGLLADGAIGSEIYNRGVFVNRNYDELNLSNPKLIEDIHLDYLAAGSSLIETNTFTANALRLRAFGLEEKLEDINRAGVRIAKKAAQGKAYVGGAVGPIGSAIRKALISDDEIRNIFKEQIAILADEGVDVILMETFTNLKELHQAYLAVREVCDLPVVTQISTKYVGEDEFVGIDPERAARVMTEWGADVIGMNCGNGPEGLLVGITKMSKAVNALLSAMPNAGVPKAIDGRLFNMASPEYMAEYARRYAQVGVSLIGGCCGTTPAMIREMKNFLKPLRPTTRVEIVVQKSK
ncbi:homocysteine S-methyltransferase family protein, partial [bacterium]|nr:homocysteine S-methyltransferase family protein [bacterium]